MTSTADYFGIYNINTKDVESIFMTPDENRSEISVAGLPITLGFKRLRPEKYPGRPIYVLNFNVSKLTERIKDQNQGMSDNELIDQLDHYKTQLKNRMPYRVKLSRQIRENKEKITIDSVLDKDRNEVSPSLFTLSLQTLPNEGGYWLDTGEFLLSIRD